MDSLTRIYYDTLMPSLQAVVDGEGVNADLAEEITALDNCPVDEGLGESYHRATHLTKLRSSAARNPWILSSTRLSQNISRCTRCTKQYGKRGKAVFRFEWKNYKRVIRMRRRNRFRACRMRDKVFFQKLYRLQSDASDDWGPVLGSDPVASNKTDGTTRMQHEYLQKTFQNRGVYSVPSSGACDKGYRARDRRFFQVLAVHNSQSRPKLVETMKTGPFILNITIFFYVFYLLIFILVCAYVVFGMSVCGIVFVDCLSVCC